jgi:transposase
MIGLPPGTKVFLACQPIDLRAGFDGLAAKVQQIIGADPFSGHVFIFRSKRGHYLKGLYWDGSGLCHVLSATNSCGRRSSTAR